MPGGGVAVEVDAAALFEDAFAGQQARGHVGQVGGQAATSADLPRRGELQQPIQLLVEVGVTFGDVFEGIILGFRPDPGVLKDAGLGLAAERDVVIAFGVEGGSR